jgi:FkbM family methyltransferase
VKISHKISAVRIGSFSTLIPNYGLFTIKGYSDLREHYLHSGLETKRWIMRNLPDDGVFIDVGANVGILSACASLKAPNGLVVAIESSKTIKLLRVNLQQLISKGARILILNSMIGNFDSLKLRHFSKFWRREQDNRDLDFKRLDDVIESLSLERVDVIRIDTKGLDFDVLNSASTTIRIFRPYIILNIRNWSTKEGFSQQKLFRFLIDNKYSTCLILDGETFVFSSNWEIGKEWPNAISVHSDREAFKFESAGDLILSTNSPGTTYVERTIEHKNYPNFQTFRGQIEPWAFVAVFQIKTQLVASPRILLSIQGELYSGSLAFAAISQDSSQLVSEEIVVDKVGRFELDLNVFDFQNRFVVRTTSAVQFRVQIDNISLYQVGSQLLLDVPSVAEIPIIEPKDLVLALNLNQDTCCLPELFGSDDGYLMEQSSAHLLKSLYRHLKPMRHLEIGTWEGFGAELALSNGAHEVWSIEKYDNGNPEYGSRYLSKSESVRPGWIVSPMNRERFHQYFGTVQDFSQKQSGVDPFNTILIDGAHDKQSVILDTRFALSVTSAGAIVIWDDYPVLTTDNNSTKNGVLQAIKELLPELSRECDLMAIRGTALLIGIRKPKP